MGVELNIYLNHSRTVEELWRTANAITQDSTIKLLSLKINEYASIRNKHLANRTTQWKFIECESFEEFIQSLTPSKRGVFFPEINNNILGIQFGKKGIIINTDESYGLFTDDLNIIKVYRPLVNEVAKRVQSSTSIYFPNSHCLAECISELVWQGYSIQEIERWLSENNIRRSPTVSEIKRLIPASGIGNSSSEHSFNSELDAYYQEKISTCA